MGCWEETCALTNTPIYNGERCVMLELDEPQLGIYLKFSPLSPMGTKGSDHQWRMFKALHRGTYNDYGWLEELDRRDRFWPCIFFHEKVWDWALKTAKPLPEWKFESDLYPSLSSGPSGLVVTDWLRDIARVCDLAFWLRRNIFSGLMFQGHQEGEITKRQREEFFSLQADITTCQEQRWAEGEE
jgi:hypothetical protein